MKRYSKFFIAAAMGLTVLAVAVGDGVITSPEVFEIMAAILGPLGVYLVPNKPSTPDETPKAGPLYH